MNRSGTSRTAPVFDELLDEKCQPQPEQEDDRFYAGELLVLHDPDGVDFESFQLAQVQ